MSNYSISKSSMDDEQLDELYEKVTSSKGIENKELDTIFKLGLKDRDLFPGIREPKGGLTEEEYLQRWIDKYLSALSNPPSKRIAEKKKTCSDPALKRIVKKTMSLSDDDANNAEMYHNLFMAAENVQGNLLEEYIAGEIKAFGWIWCQGSCLRAIDFCKDDGSVLLQIKNKYNTENSSSSAIRDGTSIKKWYRLKDKTIKGIKYPSFNWDALNELINNHLDEDCSDTCEMTEDTYAAFLDKVISSNKQLIKESKK